MTAGADGGERAPTTGPGVALAAADAAVVDRWWTTFVATGALPSELPLVQGRLVRAVHRGELPSGPVYVKVMTFPRAKDRLRYLLRALPAQHEAAMLGRLAAARVPCPEVVAVRTQRRLGLPARSLLVLRALPVAAASAAAAEDPQQRLRDEAALAVRLLAAGIEHHDLHGGNFVRLADGRLAVLDLQSARPSARAGSDRARLAAAARLVRDRHGDDAVAMAALLAAGLLHDAAEVAGVLAQRQRDAAHFRRSRAHRCLRESTEYTWQLRLTGREFRLRAGLGDGRWWWGGDELRRAWIGQCVLRLDAGTAPTFHGFFQKWWWLGGAAALYVPRRLADDGVDAAVRDALTGWGRLDVAQTRRDAEAM